MAWIMTTTRERYRIADNGDVTRLDMPGFQPSGQWKILGLVRYNNFGAQVDYIPLARWAEFRGPLRHKNGKPRYRVRDLDHGSTREWSDAILSLHAE